MTDEQLDLIFAALADPTRRAILARLAKGEATVLELAEPFDISLPAVSKHLKVLDRAGLISRTRRAQWLHCRLEPAQLDEARTWIDRQQDHWEASFDQMDALMREMQASTPDRTDCRDPKEEGTSRT